MAAAVFATSTSAKTRAGALPPSSRCARLSVFAAPLATAMPARTLPVIETRPGSGCSTIATPVPPLPSTMFITPSGRMP